MIIREIAKTSKNPPGRAAFQALQCVVECIGDDMVKLKDGEILKWPWGIKNPVLYNMDTEISALYPKSWHERIHGKTFSEEYKNNAEMQDNRIQYNER